MRTLRSHRPYATTVFAYIRRAMPFNPPQSLSAKMRSLHGVKARGAKLLIGVVLAGFAAGIAYAFWRHAVLFPSTDDAYIQAHVIEVAAQVTGKIVRVHVQNQQPVNSGELLLELDRTPFELAVQERQAAVAEVKQSLSERQAAVAAAAARVNSAEVSVANAQRKALRAAELVQKKFVSQQSYDDARAEEKTAQAQLQLAQAQLAQAQRTLGETGNANAQLREAAAQLAQAQWALDQTVVTASCDGRVAELSLRPGDTVQASRSSFRIVCNDRFWVDANFQETDLERIRVGQTASISVDMYPNQAFAGRVASISPAAGSAFSLLPPQNATGNWVKVTQRVPVRVEVLHPDPQHPLRVGTSATVTIDTTSDRG